MSQINNEELQKSLILTGATEYKSDFFSTDMYKQLSEALMTNLDENELYNIKFKKIPFDDIIKFGKQFILKHTNGIDLKVFYTNNDYIKSKVITKFGLTPKPSQYDEIKKFIRQNAFYLDITDVPVKLEKRDRPDGYIRNTDFYDLNEVELNFYNNLGYYIYELGLAGECDEYMQTTYIHEMYHGLLNRNNGSIKNLLLYEALPIFMEKVATLDFNFSEETKMLNTYVRLLYTKIRVKFMPQNDDTEQKQLKIIDNQTYILSTLLATNLFEIYKDASNKIKAEIDDDINSVLIGKGQLDDVFTKYGVSATKGAQLLMEQIKYFTNKAEKHI